MDQFPTKNEVSRISSRKGDFPGDKAMKHRMGSGEVQVGRWSVAVGEQKETHLRTRSIRHFRR